jgi:hypothetical protein
MDFSNNRKRPRIFGLEEAERADTKKTLLKEIQKICKCVEIKVTTTSEQNYIYEITDVVKSGVMRSESIDQSVRFLTVLLEEIKRTFNGCNIIIDPLETYIMIDWS